MINQCFHREFSENCCADEFLDLSGYSGTCAGCGHTWSHSEVEINNNNKAGCEEIKTADVSLAQS